MKRQIGVVVIAIVALAGVACNDGTENKVTELEEVTLPLNLQLLYQHHVYGWTFVDRENDVYAGVVRPIKNVHRHFYPPEFPSFEGIPGKVSPGNYVLFATIVIETDRTGFHSPPLWYCGPTYDRPPCEEMRPDLKWFPLTIEDVQLDNMQSKRGLLHNNSNLVQRVSEEVNLLVAGLQAEQRGEKWLNLSAFEFSEVAEE